MPDDTTSGPERPALPIEDRMNGLYINRPWRGMEGIEVTSLAGDGDETRYLVPAEDFMAVQKERDEHHKALYLIASQPEAFQHPQIRRILERAGIDWKVAESVGEIARQVQAGTFG